MNRRRADAVVGMLLGFVLLAGGVLSWQAYQQRRAFEQSMGSMMDSSMGTMHGPDPLWYVVGTLLVAGLIGGVYSVAREELTDSKGTDSAESIDSDQTSAVMTTPTSGEDSQARSINPESDPQARVLDLLRRCEEKAPPFTAGMNPTPLHELRPTH